MYWEKTVEYLFLTSLVQEKKIDLATPLAGKEEHGAGDAIFGKDAKLILVEFKSDKSELDTECSLFIDYDLAKELLGSENRDKHHLFVYGVKSSNMVVLEARTYFSRQPAMIKNCMDKSCSSRDFKSYLCQLLALKHPDGRSSSGQIGVNAYASVMGVSASGSIVKAVSLQDYTNQVFPNFMPAPPVSPTSPAPGRGPKP